MSGISYYVIDLETLGLSCGYHEVTQISIIRCADRHQLTKWIRPKYPERASPQALEATGRSYKDLFTGQSAEIVVEACNNFILGDGLTAENRCFVAHNSSFDQRFCHHLWGSLGKTFPGVMWLDSQAMARQWAKKLGIVKPKLTLEASLKFAGLTPIDTVEHEAAADTRNTYLLYRKAIEAGIDHLELIKRIPHIINE